MNQAIIEDILVFVGVIVAMWCFTGLLVTWFKYRARRLGGGVPADLAHRLDEIADRLARMDNGVEAVAVEIERISEAQRFTTKLLAERALPSAGEKQRTP